MGPSGNGIGVDGLIGGGDTGGGTCLSSSSLNIRSEWESAVTTGNL